MANPWLLVGLAALGIAALRDVFKTKKVFVSYYYDADSRYKNMLKAWSENDKFDFEFDDVSADLNINSESDAVLKRALSRRLKEADVVLVIVGEATHARRWVAWEVDKALELEKPIVAVKIKATHESPKELLGVGVRWAHSFDYDSIRTALDAV